MLLEPMEDRPIAVWGWRRPGAGIAGPARAPSWLAPPIHHPLAPAASQRGFAYLKAGKPEEARTALSEALSGLDDHAVKQRAVFLTDLATTYLHDDEIDKGAEVAAEAADVLSRAGYATSVERLHEFRGLVQPWQDRASVKELDERLARV
jgi:hypothetical protein